MRQLSILIVEDEFLSRQLLMTIVAKLGKVDVAVNGVEAVTAFRMAYDAGTPYDVVFLDIMLPAKDGQTVLKEMRAYEQERGVLASSGTKVIMTTALSDSKSIMEAFRSQCESYVTKPYNEKKIMDEFNKLKFE
jgi:two-component system, chemotaxis family, chemotaxis protein CheY